MHPMVMAVASIGLSVAAQFCLKLGMSSPVVKAVALEQLSMPSVWGLVTQPCVVGGLALYVLGAVVWLGVLSQWEVSKAYPLVGLGFALTAGIRFFIGEQVTFLRAGRVALICAGVFLVART